MNTEQKILCGILVMTAWGALVWQGLTPVNSFVDALRDILVTLGIVHIALTDPKSVGTKSPPPPGPTKPEGETQ